MAKEIMEDEVRDDVMDFANLLFERAVTDDPLGVVDVWVSEWRSCGLIRSVLRTADCAGRPEIVATRNPQKNSDGRKFLIVTRRAHAQNRSPGGGSRQMCPAITSPSW